MERIDETVVWCACMFLSLAGPAVANKMPPISFICIKFLLPWAPVVIPPTVLKLLFVSPAPLC